MSKETIAVLGGGSWGATLGNHLAHQGHSVSVWEYDAEIAKKLDTERSLPTLPQIKLHKSVRVSNNISEVLEGRDVILSVTPSHTVRATFSRKDAVNSMKRGAMVINASKGIEQETHNTMSQIIQEIFTEVGDIVILSGPSHAEEVALGQPVALVSASSSMAASKKVQDLFTSEQFRIYTSIDPIGVELGGALKNVYALACGVVDGLSLGDNIKAALITRALAEMTRLGQKLDAAALTFFGLAGLGDLIVTCNSQHSRNRRLGEMLGKGDTLEKALGKMTMVAEGVNTTKSAYTLAKRKEVDVPIINEMYKVLFENKSPRSSLKDLMSRQVGSEMEGIVL